MRFTKTAVIIVIICIAAVYAAPAFCAGGVIRDPRSPDNRADYLVITPKAFYGPLKPLLKKRSHDGLSVGVVAPEQIYEHFPRFGPGPQAIREFVLYAYNNWEVQPKYLLLNGDINVYERYDPEAPVVPTFMVPLGDSDFRNAFYTASDAPFGDMDGDEIPEIAVGRLPADTPEDVDNIVKKIIRYETDPPPGPWRRRISLFASTGNFGIFDTTLEELTKRITRNNFDPLFDVTMTYAGARLPYFILPDGFGKQVVNRFNEGSLFMSYIGHGHVTGFSSVCWRGDCEDILEIDDIGEIHTRGKAPFFFSVCCLTGKFNTYRDCIVEEMLKRPDGPVGVFAASEVSAPYSNAILSKDVMYYLIVNRPETIGEGVLNIHRGLVERMDPDRQFLDRQYKLIAADDEMMKDAVDHVYMYNFLGDPATKIAYPRTDLEVAAPAEAKAGDRIKVKVTASGGPAKMILTLECHPTEIIYPVVEIEDDEGLKGKELAGTVASNYRNANNKVAVRVEAEVGADGRAEEEIEIPGFLPPAEYYVKAYAWDGVPDQTGMTTINIANKGYKEPARKKKKEEKKKERLFDRVARIARKMREPDVSKLSIARGKEWKGLQPGDPVSRMTELEERLAGDPGNTEAALELAGIYLDWGRYDDVDKVLEGVVEAGEEPEALEMSARAMSNDGNSGGAVDLVKGWMEKHGESPEAYAALAESYKSMGEIDSAEEAYLSAAGLAEAGSPVQQDLIYFYMWLRRDYEKAAEKAREVIASGTLPSARVLRLLAEALLKIDESKYLDEAFELSWKYYKLTNRDHPRAMAVASMVGLLGLERSLTARDYFDRALEIAPDCAGCLTVDYWRLGGVLAKEYCARAVEIDPKHTPGYTCLGQKYLEGEEYEEAAENFLKAYEIDSNRLDRAMIEAMIEAMTRAEPGEEKSGDSEKEEGDAAPAPDYESMALDMIADMELSWPEYSKFKDENNALAKIVFFGTAEKFSLEKQRDKEEKEKDGKDTVVDEADPPPPGEAYKLAENAYREYIEEHPGGYKPHHFMAGINSYRGDWARAADYEKLAVENNPRCVNALAALGEYSMAARQWRDAREAFTRALELRPDDRELESNIAAALLELGRREEARKIVIGMMESGRYVRRSAELLDRLVDPVFYLVSPPPPRPFQPDRVDFYR